MFKLLNIHIFHLKNTVFFKSHSTNILKSVVGFSSNLFFKVQLIKFRLLLRQSYQFETVTLKSDTAGLLAIFSFVPVSENRNKGNSIASIGQFYSQLFYGSLSILKLLETTISKHSTMFHSSSHYFPLCKIVGTTTKFKGKKKQLKYCH